MVKRLIACVFAVAAAVAFLSFKPAAMGAVAWDEAVHGDLSDNGSAPSTVVLGAGTHSLLGSTQSGDLDYISVKIPAGQQFTQFILQDYESTDFTAFVAVQAGSTFTAAPPIPPVASLLGYSHFGPNASFGAARGRRHVVHPGHRIWRHRLRRSLARR